MTDSLPFKIPEDATLKEVIIVLNHLGLVAHQTDKAITAWIYEHQDWICDKDA